MAGPILHEYSVFTSQSNRSEGGTLRTSSVSVCFILIPQVDKAILKFGVLCRNPWGRTEWTGPWSDGSKEWTPEWMQLLGHTFGDDGQFWMTYKDFLRKFSIIDRTRLFDSSWHVTEGRWLNYQVPWSADYAASRFEITVHNETPVVVVLSQLDTRFFKGLEGRYSFELTFRIHKDGEEDYLVRSQPNGI